MEDETTRKIKQARLDTEARVTRKEIEHEKNAIHAGQTHITATGWYVTLLAPGFLGVLFNASQLAAHSHLRPEIFTRLFIATEISFLVGILAGVYFYRSVVLSITASSGKLLWLEEMLLLQEAERDGLEKHGVAVTPKHLTTEQIKTELDKIFESESKKTYRRIIGVSEREFNSSREPLAISCSF